MVKRKTAPDKNVWALPGLRMYKGESINDTLVRIAQDELGLQIDPSTKQLWGQYVGKFSSEHQRQDISTAYVVAVPETQPVTINQEHFSKYDLVTDIPQPIGAMYKYDLGEYFQFSSAG